MTELTQKPDELPIVIVGGGPAGMAMALGAYQRGERVVLVTKYPFISRRQRVALKSNFLSKTSEQLDLLKSFADFSNPKDIAFFQKLAKNNYTASIGSIERYLQRKIDKIIEQEKNLPREQKKFLFMNETQGKISAIDLNLNEVPSQVELFFSDTEETRKINTNLIIDASGGRRVAFNLAKKNQPIEQKLVDQPRHLAQGTSIFHLNVGPNIYPKLHKKWWEKLLGYTKTVFVPKSSLKFSAEDMFALKDLGWEEPYPPNVYVIANATRTKFYVGGEIPGNILNIKDDAQRKLAVERWNKHILEHHFGIAPQHLFLKNKADVEKIEQYKLALMNLNLNHLADLPVEDKTSPTAFLETVLEPNIYSQIMSYKDIKTLPEEVALRLAEKIVWQKQIDHYIEKFNLFKGKDKQLVTAAERKKAEDIAVRAIYSKIDLQVTAFPMEMTRVNEIKNSKGQSVIYAVGDAHQSPHFHFSHGINDAFKSVKKLLSGLHSRNFEEFETHQQKITQQHDERLASLQIQK